MVTPGVQATRVAPLIGNARSVLRNRAKTGRRRCNDSPLPAPLSLSRCNLVSRNGCMRYLSPFPDCSPPIFSLSLSRILLFNVGENFCCLTVWWFFQSSSRSRFLKYKIFASIRDEESRFSFFFSLRKCSKRSRALSRSERCLLHERIFDTRRGESPFVVGRWLPMVILHGIIPADYPTTVTFSQLILLPSPDYFREL